MKQKGRKVPDSGRGDGIGGGPETKKYLGNFRNSKEASVATVEEAGRESGKGTGEQADADHRLWAAAPGKHHGPTCSFTASSGSWRGRSTLGLEGRGQKYK